MKTVRKITIVFAAVLLVAAFVAGAAAPALAGSMLSANLNAPAQAFMDAAHGLPLLAPMSIAAPLISIQTENATNSYSCSLISQTPIDWTKMRARQSFDAAWTVQNTGAYWHASAMKFGYVGGQKMQTRGNETTLSEDVGKGKRVKLVVDMEAPKTRGTFSTLWALYSGNQKFCRVTLTITVVR